MNPNIDILDDPKQLEVDNRSVIWKILLLSIASIVVLFLVTYYSQYIPLNILEWNGD